MALFVAVDEAEASDDVFRLDVAGVFSLDDVHQALIESGADDRVYSEVLLALTKIIRARSEPWGVA